MSGGITREDIADSVDWLGSMDSEIEFFSSHKLRVDGEFTGDVYLEGRIQSTGEYVTATYRLIDPSVSAGDDWIDDDEADWT